MSLRRGCCLFGEEVEEGGVDHLGVGPGDVVRAAFNGDEGEVAAEFAGDVLKFLDS